MSLAHHSLVAWQRADDLFIRVHSLSLKAFPAFEQFELGSQIRRAAYSVSANIVEGFAHSPGRARLNFLKVSHASLAEVGYCIPAIAGPTRSPSAESATTCLTWQSSRPTFTPG